jgi:hypothetical protein
VSAVTEARTLPSSTDVKSRLHSLTEASCPQHGNGPETAFEEITERAELRRTTFSLTGLVLHGKEGRDCAGVHRAPCSG